MELRRRCHSFNCQLSFETQIIFQSINMLICHISQICPNVKCLKHMFLTSLSDATCDSSMTDASYLPSVTCSRDHVSQSLSSLAPCQPRDKVRNMEGTCMRGCMGGIRGEWRCRARENEVQRGTLDSVCDISLTPSHPLILGLHSSNKT